tara:strand:+ start:4900 stop:5268 length:369 start_codon:yes stop_codon:yes gene_type:complete
MKKQMTKSTLEKARHHFHSALAHDLIKIEVPEWEETIYFKAATNFAVEKKIIELHGKGDLVEALVETLIAKSLTKDGKKMFTAADKVVLMREVDPEVIIRIVGAMNDAKKEAQDAMGNSPKI